MKIEESPPHSAIKNIEPHKRCYSKTNVPSHSDIHALKVAKPFIQEATCEKKLKIVPTSSLSSQLKTLFDPQIDEILAIKAENASSSDLDRVRILKKDLEECERWIQLMMDLIGKLKLNEPNDSKLIEILQKVLKRSHATNS